MLSALIEKFSSTRAGQAKAIFASLFILQNRLQTVFDREDPELTLKQFLLLILVRQAPRPQTLTQLGALLGCSRQNVKKLARALEQKGFAALRPCPADPRACTVTPLPGMEAYFARAAQAHETALATLFSGYSDEELAQLFRLLSKLYQGTERLEETSHD